MALKFKIAWSLAIFTGIITVFLSLVYSVRPVSVFYRGGFTTVVFFVLGYIIGIFVESYLKKLIETDAHKGKKIDITAEPDSDILLEETATGEETSGTDFKPLNPDDFTSFTPPQK